MSDFKVGGFENREDAFEAAKHNCIAVYKSNFIGLFLVLPSGVTPEEITLPDGYRVTQLCDRESNSYFMQGRRGYLTISHFMHDAKDLYPPYKESLSD